MTKTRYLLWGLFWGATAATVAAAIVAARNREKVQAALERGREARELAGDAWDVVQRTKALRRPLGAE